MSTFLRFRTHRLGLILLSLLSTIGCDQATKIVAKDTLLFSGRLSYFGDMIRFQYIENPGAFLSLGASLPHQYRFWIFSVAVSACLFAAALLLFMKPANALSTIGLTLTVGGGIGNMIDRWTHDSVVDFINIGIGNFRTGIFNIADVAIMTGVTLIIVESLKTRSSISTG